MSLDLPAYLRASRIEFSEGRPNPQGFVRYHCDCLFDPNHRGKDAYFYVSPAGRPGYHCSHQSCRGKRWPQVTELIESRGGPTRPEMSAGREARYRSAWGGEAAPGGRAEPRWDPRPEDFTDWTDLALEKFDWNWLVDRVLLRDESIVVGGPDKSMKTSIMLDLVVSLASGTPWLGEWRVPARVKCLVISAETSRRAIQNLILRIIRSRPECLIPPGFLSISQKLPRLSIRQQAVELREHAIKEGVQLVFIDPLYMSLLERTNAKDASNVFAMGVILGELNDVFNGSGVTLALVHHFNKAGGQVGLSGEAKPPSLRDLSQSGVAEWARQWVLLKRRRMYGRDGLHQLYLDYGGSSGQCGLFSVEIDEGSGELAPWDRKWEVEVTKYQDAKDVENAKSEEDIEKRVIACVSMGTNGKSGENGVTRTELREYVGVSGKQINEILKKMIEAGRVKQVISGRVTRICHKESDKELS